MLQCPSTQCVAWENAPKEWNRTDFCQVPSANKESKCITSKSDVQCPEGMDKRTVYLQEPTGCIVDCANHGEDALPENRCASKDKCLKSSQTCRANPGWNPRSKDDNFYWACRDKESLLPLNNMTEKDCADADPTKFIKCGDDSYEPKKRWSAENCNFYCTKKEDSGGGWLKWVIIIAVAVGVLLLLMMLMHHGKHDD